MLGDSYLTAVRVIVVVCGHRDRKYEQNSVASLAAGDGKFVALRHTFFLQVLVFERAGTVARAKTKRSARRMVDAAISESKGDDRRVSREAKVVVMGRS